MYRENELETYRIAADPNLTPEQKQAQIDALYSGAALPTIPEPTADARLASNAPGFGPVNKGQLADVVQGFNTQAPAPVAPGAHMATGPAPTTSAGLMAHPPAVAAAPAAAHAAPVEPGVPGQPAATQEDADAANEARAQQDYKAVLESALRPTAGARIPAHDQPISTVVESGAPIPDEIKERIGASQQAEAGKALEAGDVNQQNAELAKDAAEQSRTDEERRLIEFRAQEAKSKQQFDDIEDKYQTMVKESAIPSNEWFTDRSTMSQIGAVLGALAMGLGGRPEMVSQLIRDDMSHRVAERDKKLGAFRQKMEDIQKQMISPEAARNLELGMSSRIAAAEAQRIAAAASSAEAKVKAEQAAQHLLTDAAKYEAAAAQSEVGTRKTQIQHVAERYSSAPSMLDRVAGAAKKAGITPEEYVRRLNNAGGGGDIKPDDMKRMVLLPDGTPGFATSDDSAKQAQTTIDSGSALEENLNQILRYADNPGHTIAGADRARIETNLAANLSNWVANAKSEGGSAKLSPEVIDRVSSLLGGKALETSTADGTLKANLDEAKRIISSQRTRTLSQLMPGTKVERNSGKVKTLGKNTERTAADLGAKKE